MPCHAMPCHAYAKADELKGSRLSTDPFLTSNLHVSDDGPRRLKIGDVNVRGGFRQQELVQHLEGRTLRLRFVPERFQ
jgi:hypothetical protein